MLQSNKQSVSLLNSIIIIGSNHKQLARCWTSWILTTLIWRMTWGYSSSQKQRKKTLGLRGSWKHYDPILQPKISSLFCPDPTTLTKLNNGGTFQESLMRNRRKTLYINNSSIESPNIPPICTRDSKASLRSRECAMYLQLGRTVSEI